MFFVNVEFDYVEFDCQRKMPFVVSSSPYLVRRAKPSAKSFNNWIGLTAFETKAFSQ
jgi:hypothetical protein